MENDEEQTFDILSRFFHEYKDIQANRNTRNYNLTSYIHMYLYKQYIRICIFLTCKYLLTFQIFGKQLNIYIMYLMCLEIFSKFNINKFSRRQRQKTQCLIIYEYEFSNLSLLYVTQTDFHLPIYFCCLYLAASNEVEGIL